MSEIVTIVGRLGADPELRFTPSGDAICNMRIVTDRRYKDGDEWKSADTTWWSVSAWRQLGENVAESLSKGDMVIVRGSIKSREYETKEGEKRTVWEVEAKAVGPDLSRATAKVNKVERGGGGFPAAAESDPWATPAATAQTNPIPF